MAFNTFQPMSFDIAGNDNTDNTDTSSPVFNNDYSSQVQSPGDVSVNATTPVDSTILRGSSFLTLDPQARAQKDYVETQKVLADAPSSVYNQSKDDPTVYRAPNSGYLYNKPVESQWGDAARALTGYLASYLHDGDIGNAVSDAYNVVQTHEDQVQRFKDVDYLEDKGYNPSDIQRYIVSGDPKDLVMNKSQWQAAGSGIIFDTQSGQWMDLNQRQAQGAGVNGFQTGPFVGSDGKHYIGSIDSSGHAKVEPNTAYKLEDEGSQLPAAGNAPDASNDLFMGRTKAGEKFTPPGYAPAPNGQHYEASTTYKTDEHGRKSTETQYNLKPDSSSSTGNGTMPITQQSKAASEYRQWNKDIASDYEKRTIAGSQMIDMINTGKDLKGWENLTIMANSLKTEAPSLSPRMNQVGHAIGMTGNWMDSISRSVDKAYNGENLTDDDKLNLKRAAQIQQFSAYHNLMKQMGPHRQELINIGVDPARLPLPVKPAGYDAYAAEAWPDEGKKSVPTSTTTTTTPTSNSGGSVATIPTQYGEVKITRPSAK